MLQPSQTLVAENFPGWRNFFGCEHIKKSEKLCFWVIVDSFWNVCITFLSKYKMFAKSTFFWSKIYDENCCNNIQYILKRKFYWNSIYLCNLRCFVANNCDLWVLRNFFGATIPVAKHFCQIWSLQTCEVFAFSA